MRTAKSPIRSQRAGYNTYNGWLRAGRHVNKGEKSRLRDKDGTPIFHVSATSPMCSLHFDDDGDYYDSWTEYGEDLDSLCWL